MKLTYRGIAYLSNSVELIMFERNMTNKYRGIIHRFKKPVSVTVRSASSLKYRGIEYKVGSNQLNPSW